MSYIRLTRVGQICDNDGMYLRKTGKWMGWVSPPSAFLGGNLGNKGSTVVIQAQVHETVCNPLKICSQFPQMPDEGNVYPWEIVEINPLMLSTNSHLLKIGIFTWVLDIIKYTKAKRVEKDRFIFETEYCIKCYILYKTNRIYKSLFSLSLEMMCRLFANIA